MKLYIDDGATKITIENERTDLNIYEMLEIFEQAALGLSYLPESWEDAILDLADEIEDRRQRAQFMDEPMCPCGCGLTQREADEEDEGF